MRARDEAVRGLRIRHRRRYPHWRRGREEMRTRLSWPAQGAPKTPLSARNAGLRPQVRERGRHDVSVVHGLLPGRGRPALLAPGAESSASLAGPLTPSPQAASAALAFSAIAWNAAGSWIARSDSTLRSTVMPDFDRPLIKTL